LPFLKKGVCRAPKEKKKKTTPQKDTTPPPKEKKPQKRKKPRFVKETALEEGMSMGGVCRKGGEKIKGIVGLNKEWRHFWGRKPSQGKQMPSCRRNKRGVRGQGEKRTQF